MPIENMQLLIGVAVALVLSLVTFNISKVTGKKVGNMNKNFVLFGLVVFIVGALWLGGVGDFVNPSLASPLAAAPLVVGVPTSAPLIEVDTGLCAVEDTTVTLAGQDKYDTSATGGTHRYRVSMDSGLSFAPAQTVSDSGTFTASPGNVIEILWNNEVDSADFGILDLVVVPCKGTETFFANTVNNGTLTTRVFNEEGNLISDPENETLEAGDVVNLDIEIQGQFERDFPYGFVLVTEYNKTTIDEIDFILDGVTLTETSVPTDFTTALGSDSSKQAFIVPAVMSNKKLVGTITIDADDNTNPANSGSDILFTYFPQDYFVNEDEGGRVDAPAPEDEDDNAIRTILTYTLQID